MKMILSCKHSGFNVHISEAIPAGDKAAFTRVARYMLRSPVVISRLSYDREGQKVRIKKRNPASGDDIVLDVLRFIARLSAANPEFP